MADEYDEVNHVPGLKTDLELLLTHFTNSKSVRYAEFAKIWRQMGFPTIFCGWGKEEVLREMIETALRLSVGFWNDIYTFQVRMGGLYLMYAFYFSQPLDPPQKIRLTQSQWAAGRKLLGIIQDQKHLDAEYVYHRLHYYKAFYYVMSPSPYQVAQTRRSASDVRREVLPLPEKPEPRSTTTSVQNVFPAAFLNNMESLHNQYRDMKSQFISAGNMKEAEGLHTLKEDFYDVLKGGLKHMESWKPGSSSFDPDEVAKVSTAVVPTSPGRQGVNRRRLKEHAFERSGVMGRHLRHLGADSSPSDSEKPFASPKKRPAKRKKRRSEESGSVSQEEVVNSSMPLGFDDDDDDGDDDDGKSGGFARRKGSSSSEGQRSMESGDLEDAILRAMGEPSPRPGFISTNNGDDDNDQAMMTTTTPTMVTKTPDDGETSSKKGKGKGKRKGKSPAKWPSPL